VTTTRTRLPRLVSALAVASVFSIASPGIVRALDKSAVVASTPSARNPLWAAPRRGPGLHNFYQVSPTLYRGAQPTREGLEELRRLGVKTVVSLRAFHGEREAVKSAGLGYERISFKVWHPEDEDMVRFLRVATDPERQPVYVHCLRGADRTGTAVAVYRICVQGWTKEDAIDEMANGGYTFAKRFTHLERYLRSLDVDALRLAVPRPLGPQR
jgi:protein tyrosine phosphatase (PTP) superfamily phosphohydrolase (DUF442 family)